MKKCFLLFAVIVFFMVLNVPVWAEEPGVVESYQDEEKTFEDAISDLDNYLQDNYRGFSLSEIYNDIKDGEYEFDFSSLKTIFSTALFGQVKVFLMLLSQLIILGVLSALIESFGANLGSGEIAKVGQWVLLFTFAYLTIKSGNDIISSASMAIENVSMLLYSVLPLLFTVLSSLGGMTSLMIVKPTVLFFSTAFIGVTERFLLPLVLVVLVLSFVNHLYSKGGFTQLTKLIRDVIMVGITLMMTVFTAVLGLETVVSSAIDGVGVKTIKTAAGSFIPIIGRHIADAFDTLMGLSLVFKNSIGILALVAVAAVLLLPSVKILCAVLCYRITAAIMEPLGAKGYTELVRDIAGAFTLLFALVGAVGLFMFVALFFVIGASNLTVMFQ